MLILWLCFFLVIVIDRWHFSWDCLGKLEMTLILSLPCLKSSKAPLVGHIPDPSMKSRPFLTHPHPCSTFTPSQCGQPPPSLHAPLLLYSQAFCTCSFLPECPSALLKAWFTSSYLSVTAFFAQEMSYALGSKTLEKFAAIGRKV